MLIEQYVFIWNVPLSMKWRDVHGLIHTKVIRVEEMAVHEEENYKNESKVAIMRVFSTTESVSLEREINEMEMNNGERVIASVETSLYIFFITNYSVHIPNFIRQNLRDVNIRVEDRKGGVIRCEFSTYGEFTRAFKSIEAMMANNVKMKLYRYEKGGNKLPPPSILSLKFSSVPIRDESMDSALVPYTPPTTQEINTWVMEQDYNMWNALHAVKFPSIRHSRMHPQRSDVMRISQQDKSDLMANNCLFLVRSLRARAYKLHEDIFTSLEEKESGEEMKKRIVPLCIKLNKNYDELEVNVLRLPDKTALDRAKLERIKYLFQEEQMDTAHCELIDKLIRATNYNEGNLQFNLYLSTFMQTTRRKNYSQMIPHSVSFSNFDVKSNPHATFEQCLLQCHKDNQAKRTGIFINILEKNSYSCVFELRSGTYMTDRSKAFVCFQKAVIVENGGSIDKLCFYAPNEDLAYMDDFGERRVDLRASSRYEVYRRLSVNTNIYLINHAPITDFVTMRHTLMWISKVYKALESPCRVCKKVLKDFLPPTVYMPANTNNANHETCR